MSDASPAESAPVFPASSFVRAHLWQEPLYAEEADLWRALLMEREEIRAWFRQAGLELVIDEPEGYAFLRQMEPEGDERVPRLMRKQKLTYDATLLLVCLRDELNRFDTRTADQSALIRSRQELYDLVAGFLPESTDEKRDARKIDSAIESLRELGFLRRLGGDSGEAYEIRRVIRARFGPGELETVKKRLQEHGGA
jgi:chromosome condensin MukBEF MukE localization factor